MAAETVTVLLYDNDPTTAMDTSNNSHSVDEKFIWKESTTEKLLQLYRDNPCLYDSKCKDYHNRDTKRKVLEDIARTIGVNSNAVSKKIRGLRTQYVREKNKMKIRKCGDESYVTKWSYYERLKFLDEHITARSTQFKKEDGNETDNTSVEESVNEDTEDSVGDALGNTMSYYYVDDIHQSQPQSSISEPEQTPLIKSNSLEGRRKRKLSSVEDLLLQRALDNMDSVAQKKERTSDRYEIFGMYVASEMREIEDPKWFRWAKQEIQAVLCTAQAGTQPPQHHHHHHVSCDGRERRSSPPHPSHISPPNSNHVVRRDRSRGSAVATTRLSGVELPYANSTDCLQLHTGYVQQASSIRHAD